MAQTAKPFDGVNTLNKSIRELAIAGDYRRASLVLCQFLDDLYYRSDFMGQPVPTQDRAFKLISDLLVKLIGRMPISVLEDTYTFYSKRKPHIALVLTAAGLGDTPPMVLLDDIMGRQNHDGDARRLLLLATTATLHLSPGKKLDQIIPRYAGPFIIGALGEICILTEQAEKNRKQVIDARDKIAQMDPKQMLYTGLVTAWMRCSYALTPDKHLFKKAANDWVNIWAKTAKLPSAKPRKIRDKPRLVIYADAMGRDHAMFRCHGPSAIAMRRYFHTILIAQQGADDPVVAKEFDEAISVADKTMSMDEKLAIVINAQPDMLYLPSVGMTYMSILLANIRVASVQIMSLGHPATSQGTAMDYVIMNKDLRPNPACFSEILIERPVSGGYKPSSALELDNRPHHKKAGDILQIGILSYTPKLNWRFLAILQKIEQQSTHPVQFNIMPNGDTLVTRAVERRVEKMLNSAKILPRTNYKKYMDTIGKMDLILSTFPFGNTNGTIDAFMRRLPVLTLIGDEPFERTDARLITKLGLGDALIAKNEEEYLTKALALINDDDLRQSLAEEIDYLDPENCFFKESDDHDMGDIAWHLYQGHSALQKADKKRFSYKELEVIAQSDNKTSRALRTDHA